MEICANRNFRFFNFIKSISSFDWNEKSEIIQFVVFKPLSYYFEETIGFDAKASFTSRPVSRLISWYNKQVMQQKNFDKRLFSFTGLLMDWKLQTELLKSWNIVSPHQNFRYTKLLLRIIWICCCNYSLWRLEYFLKYYWIQNRKKWIQLVNQQQKIILKSTAR